MRLTLPIVLTALAATGSLLAANGGAGGLWTSLERWASGSAVGKIEKYEAASHTLTITTSNGLVTFVVASDASIRQGSKIVTADALASRTGARAKVRYTEEKGRKMAHTIMISGP